MTKDCRIELLEVNGVMLAEICSETIEIRNAQDALEILANCGYMGSTSIIMREQNIIPDFFDLKSGIAGDVLQKFSNYDSRLAIVGDFGKYASNSLHAFIIESNRIGRIHFVTDVEDARKILASSGVAK